MPNRILKDSIRTSDSVNSLSWFEEALFYRLIVSADDFGRFDGRAAIIKGTCFPLKDGVTAKQIDAAISSLATAGILFPYNVGGKPYLQFLNWGAHQQKRAITSKYPAPNTDFNSDCEHMISDDINCNQMVSDDSKCFPNTNTNTGNENRESNTKSIGRFTPPSVQEVQAYCESSSNGINAEEFVSFYESKGWMIGKNRMKDWRAAVRTWEQKRKKPPQVKDHGFRQRDYDFDGIEKKLLEDEG